MLNLEHIKGRQRWLLGLAGGAGALVAFGMDVRFGLGLLVPVLYAGMLLGFYAVRAEGVYLALGTLGAVFTVAAPLVRRGFTWIEAIDRVVFAILIGLLAVVLSRALTYQRELRARASTDDVTGLSQEQAFIEMMTKEAGRARRYRNPFTIAVFDIDDLPRLTSTHGRATRDRLLRTLAQACAAGLRPTDLLGRVGDQVVAGLPETREMDAAVVCERLRHHTFDADAEHETPLPFEFGITVGIASFTEDDDVADVLARAVEVRDQARTTGGNRVAIAQEDAPALA
jgi:diguanylate cyclase (GGDEF)-like protein